MARTAKRRTRDDKLFIMGEETSRIHRPKIERSHLAQEIHESPMYDPVIVRQLIRPLTARALRIMQTTPENRYA